MIPVLADQGRNLKLATELRPKDEMSSYSSGAGAPSDDCKDLQSRSRKRRKE
jgi:hypothetical protein